MSPKPAPASWEDGTEDGIRAGQELLGQKWSWSPPPHCPPFGARAILPTAQHPPGHAGANSNHSSPSFPVPLGHWGLWLHAGWFKGGEVQMAWGGGQHFLGFGVGLLGFFLFGVWDQHPPAGLAAAPGPEGPTAEGGCNGWGPCPVPSGGTSPPGATPWGSPQSRKQVGGRGGGGEVLAGSGGHIAQSPPQPSSASLGSSNSNPLQTADPPPAPPRLQIPSQQPEKFVPGSARC